MSPVYKGGVRPAGQPHEATDLHLGLEGIEALTGEGKQVRMAWSSVRALEKGDAEGKVILVRGPRVVFDCDHPDFLREIEGLGGNDVADALARLSGQKVASSTSHFFKWAMVLAVLVLIFWGVPRAFRAGVDGVVTNLPYSVDESLGKAASEAMDPGGEIVEDPEVIEAVQAILDRLAPHAEMPDLELHLTVVDSEQVNAFALPGGYITVFTGLLKEAQTPEMVAGVLAHEIAHVTRRHGLRRMAHSLGLFVGLRLMLGDTSGLGGAALEVFTLANVNGYSQEQESEADTDAVRLLRAARIDPMSLADFFEYLESEYGSLPPALSWMSTHPEHGERIHAIEDQVSERAPLDYEPIELDWSALHERLQ